MLVWNPSLLLLLFLFFILSSDTREKVCSCVFKNSPRFFFFVFPFLFLLFFAGHQEKLLNGLGLNISGSGPEENSHSTAPMNDCSKNVHFKLNALEGHANFQNATILEALEKNAAKNFQLTPARQLPRMLTFVSLWWEFGMSNIWSEGELSFYGEMTAVKMHITN